jgi:hypothetical protein
MKQADLGLNLSTKRTRKREFLDQMNRVVPWSALIALIEPHYPKGKTGRRPMGLDVMRRVDLLQHWFGLSDPAMEEALRDVPLYRDRAADSRRVDRPFQPGIAGPYGYGYQFWLMPGVRRQFALIGVFGQALYVDTQAKLAMLHLAINATPRADGTTMGRERDALWRGVVSSLS